VLSRLWNLEALLLMLGGEAIVVGLSLDSKLGWLTLLVAAVWLLASVPIALRAQSAAVPLYVRLGFFQRALDLAVNIRESAPSPKIRSIGSVDVAMVQIAMGRFEAALRNLESARVARFSDATTALVIANRAYCRAHLGVDLEKALGEADEACQKLPDEGILTYIRGLVLHKLGRDAEAREAIEASLETETDPSLPVPAERPFVLSHVLRGLGEDEAASVQLALARAQVKRSPFREAIEAS